MREPLATDLLAELAGARRLAAAHDRPDLAERLDRATTQLRGKEVTVAVVGEFKQGKSTLVNALLRTDVCPVDPDVGTAVPTPAPTARPATVAATATARRRNLMCPPLS